MASILSRFSNPSQAAEDLEIRRSRSAILPTGPPGAKLNDCAPHLFHFISGIYMYIPAYLIYLIYLLMVHLMQCLWQKWSIQDRQCGSLQMKRLGFGDCRVSQVCSKFAGSQSISQVCSPHFDVSL